MEPRQDKYVGPLKILSQRSYLTNPHKHPDPLNSPQNQQFAYNLIFNDNSHMSMRTLIQFKSIISKQLPEMPKSHIARLLFDNNHKSLLVSDKQTMQIIGGVCFQPFQKQSLAQIAFFAMKKEKQKMGIGTFLMNEFKGLMQMKQIEYIVTYADNTATGFFKKQGFTKQYQLNRKNWQGFIKQYKGGIIMECRIIQNINYHNIKQTIKKQKQIIKQKINSFAWTKQTFTVSQVLENKSPFTYQNDDKQKQQFIIDPLLIPGVKQSGWKWKQYQIMKKSLTKRQYELCSQIINKLKKQQGIEYFMEPLKISDKKQYKNKPMVCLKQIEEGLLNNKFKCLQSFCTEISDLFQQFERAQFVVQKKYLNYSRQIQSYIRPYLFILLEKKQQTQSQDRKKRNRHKNTK